MRFDRAVYDGQAEACATGLGGKEGIEHAVLDCSGDAWADVRYAECNGTVAKYDAGRDLVTGEAAHFDDDPPGVGRCLHGVERDVEDRAVEEVLVAFDEDGGARRLVDELDAACTIGMRGGQSSRGVGDFPDVDEVAARLSHAREVEEFGE